MPAHRAASVRQFFTQKNVTLQIYLCQTIFLFLNLKMKLQGFQFADVAEIQEAVADELKKFQNEEFLAAFQKLYDRTKACI